MVGRNQYVMTIELWLLVDVCAKKSLSGCKDKNDSVWKPLD